jgi:hypothetical protein
MHASVIQYLLSSRGDSMVVIVLDLQEDTAEIREQLYHWLAIIQSKKMKHELILAGCHLNVTSQSKIEEIVEGFSVLENRIIPISEAPGVVSRLARGSLFAELSLPASMLLGLLEKDFSRVIFTSVSILQSHIECTGLPTISL